MDCLCGRGETGLSHYLPVELHAILGFSCVWEDLVAPSLHYLNNPFFDGLNWAARLGGLASHNEVCKIPASSVSF